MSARVDGLERQLGEVMQKIADGAVMSAGSDRVQAEATRSEHVVTEDAAEPALQAETAEEAERETEEAENEALAAPDAPQAAEDLPVAARARPSRDNLESYLGARWPVWVGGVALAFGGIFLVRYSIEAGLLGPAARLTLAALFGLLLMAGGEVVRRRALPRISELYANAMIPGALTAAGAVTLLGTVFAAYAFYDFIGPATAFVLMALVSLLTVALSLLHGQALAGLGLLGSLLTPLLVSSDDPNVNALFLFLSVTWLAVNAASRIRGWTVVPTLANLGTGAWILAYATIGTDFDPLPPALTMLVMIGGTIFLWPGQRYLSDAASGWKALLRRPPLTISLSLSIIVALGALITIAGGAAANSGSGIDPQFAFAAVIAPLAALGASRTYAVWPALIAAAGAVLGTLITAVSLLDYIAPDAFGGAPVALPTSGNEIAVTLGLGAIFTLLGVFFLKRFRRLESEFSMLWAFLMGAMPVGLGFISFLNFGNFFRDWTHGLFGLGIAVAMLAVAEWLFRGDRERQEDGFDWPANIAVAGSFAGLMLSLHALTNGIVTTILVSVAGFAYLLATRLRSWPALPWMMAAAVIVVFGRIAWQPTLIGPNSLGTTPFFNALLPGYGIPTLLAIVSAWLLRHSPDFRIRNIMQALASLSALITLAVLIHHAMNGGRLSSDIPTLGEQSLYTLITIGFSGILMTLDLKSPSPVFRFGSMIAGVVATANVLSLHVFALNPFFSGENTGPWPFVNLLLLGYLLPALAYALTAHLARERRPLPYVAMLAISGAVLGFLWATLSVRRFWQGENIADWKGFLAGETYTYSVVWLIIGVALLALGSKLNAKSLRLASAGLVLIAVLKVFLIDMANLEGILRALSFIGLGAVLIGIGLFYQRILVKKGGEPDTRDSPDATA
ncbi:DUF2339 domain-containing protein [Neorhizobium sp. NCHU2750]|uniref:DUF2339 domain-containing protein n=1 Tax=Neorhizobium sp. NCHU2750 TaxID=1825976 RepID=UPI000E75658A